MARVPDERDRSGTPSAGRATGDDGRANKNAETPTVTVVLPTYHRADVLGDAIESALAQTYRDLELVVVDDGDDDATPAVVSSFDDDRLEYVRRKESGQCENAGDGREDAGDDRTGVPTARNEGVRRTDGDLVAFVDSDDRWHHEKLRRQVEALRAAGPDCGVVYGPVTKPDGEPRTREGVTGDAFDAVRRLAVPTYTSTLLVRRAAFRAVGGFDERLGCFEDWDLCLRLARDWTFAWVDAPLVLKGSGDDNVSANPDRLADALDRIFAERDLPAASRARFLADAGRTYCEAGRLAEGRRYLRAALALDRRPKAAAAYVLALSGSARTFDAGMDAVYAAERRLAGRA